MNLFSRDYTIAIAREPQMNNAPYFTGLIRAMQQESTTHFDYAPHQLPGWWVSELDTQFAVVVYLQMPESGGELTIYNHQWKSDDDIYNKDIQEKGPYGFEDAFLRESSSVTITPEQGDMIIFNSRNFHKVESIKSSHARFGINSFIPPQYPERKLGDAVSSCIESA